MFILQLFLGAILWCAMGALMTAYIIIGATIFLLCLVVFASSTSLLMSSRSRKREVLSKYYECSADAPFNQSARDPRTPQSIRT